MFKFKHLVKSAYKNSRILVRSIPLIGAAAPKESIFIAFSILLQGLTPAISVWLTKMVIDAITLSVTQHKHLNAVNISGLVLTWVGSLLISTILIPWVALAQGSLNEKLTAHLNLLLLRKAESFPDLLRFEDPLFYDELQLVQQQISRPLSLFASLSRGGRELFTIISMSVLLLPIGLWMPALILVTTLPQAYISLQLQRKGWEIVSGQSFQARRLQYYTSLMLTDTYAKEVRLYQLGPFLTKRFLEAFQDLYKATNHLRWRQAFLSTSLAGLSALGNAFAFYWIVQQALSGKISPGSVLLLVQAIAYVQQELAQLVESYGVLYNALLYMEHLFGFLNSKPTMHVPCPGQPVPQPIHSGIEFESVHFCYPDGRTALENVSFILHPGETVALVGENGAGKTTIVKLLTRLYDPTAGRIWVDDERLPNLNLEAWRRQISVVFQDFGRYAFTLGENIALGDLNALNDLESLKNANQQAGLFKLLEKLPKEYQTPLGKQFDGTELSGGEWQKIALARAFLRAEKSQILILDEPTAALDPQSEFDVYQRFADLSRGKTTLLITHRLASVKMADRILVLKDGHLIEEGTHSMLLENGGEYAKLWHMQAKQYAS